MKNNAVSSLIWYSLMIIALTLLLVGFESQSIVIAFTSIYIWVIIFGSLYSIMNSYLVYNKLKYFDLSFRKNWILTFFPILFFLFKTELLKEKIKFYWITKYISIIFPLMISLALTALISFTQLYQSGPNTIIFAKNPELQSVLQTYEYFSLGIGIFFGFSIFVNFWVYLYIVYFQVDKTQFFDGKSIIKRVWYTIFLFYFFTKFYFLELTLAKNKRVKTY